MTIYTQLTNTLLCKYSIRVKLKCTIVEYNDFFKLGMHNVLRFRKRKLVSQNCLFRSLVCLDIIKSYNSGN